MILGDKLRSHVIVSYRFCKKRSAFDYHKLIDVIMSDEDAKVSKVGVVPCPYCSEYIYIDINSPQDYTFKDIIDN